MAYADYRELTRAKLRDTAGVISPEQMDLLIQEALKLYSSIRPRMRTQTLTGNGVAVTFALATDFEEGVSTIPAIEYPTGLPSPAYLDTEDWDFYRDPTTGLLKIRLLGFTLATAATAYVGYTARHVVSEGSGALDTVPAVDREAICDLAASLGYEQLAAYYAQEIEPSLGADLTRGQDRARVYLDLAARRRRAWEAAMGLSRGLMAASILGDLDVELAEGQGPRFFHGSRFR